MKQPCEFCAIATRQWDSHVVYEDEEILVFVDNAPIRRGHLQIIPKEHFDYFDDLPPALAGRILELGQKLAKCMKQIYKVERVGFAFTGNDVKHAHAHVVPLHDRTDITSRRYIAEEKLTFVGRPRASREAMAEVAAEIIGGLRSS